MQKNIYKYDDSFTYNIIYRDMLAEQGKYIIYFVMRGDNKIKSCSIMYVQCNNNIIICNIANTKTDYIPD